MTNFFQPRFNQKEKIAFNTLDELMTLPQISFYRKFPIIPACMKFHRFSIQRKLNDAIVNLIAEYNEGITKMKIGQLKESVEGLEEVSLEQNNDEYLRDNPGVLIGSLTSNSAWHMREPDGHIKSVMIPAKYVEELKKISIVEGKPVRKIVAKLVREYLESRPGTTQIIEASERYSYGVHNS